jgi:hypothetical protein
MDGMAVDEQSTLSLDPDLVAEGDRRASDLAECRPHDEDIIVAGGAMESGERFNDDQAHSGLFNVAIREPSDPRVLGSARLEPDEIVRVVGNSHSISLGVADAEFGLYYRPVDGRFMSAATLHLGFFL